MPSVSPHTAPGSPASPSDIPVWRGFLRRGLRNQVLCVVIGLVIWLMVPSTRGNLFTAWIYSAAIGTGCWFFIDGGRLLVSAWLPTGQRPADARRASWPGPGWMLVCIVIGTVIGYTLGTAIGDHFTGFVTPSLLSNRPAIVISLVAAVAATWYFYATERLRLEQAAAEAARRDAAESQLRLLQSQLEPHMLFNTLANLRVLITLDPPRAQAMLDRMINYLRATLGASRSALHPLAVEFARLDDYLALMSLRMGPRLQVQLDLPAALRGLPVPPLLLQPLVENCIRHGLEPKVAGGRIEVRARQQGDRLLLSVRDTGVGLGRPASETPALPPDAAGADSGSSRYGTGHVAERLATLYGSRAQFQLRAADDAEGGTLAEVSLPMPASTAANTPTSTSTSMPPPAIPPADRA